MTTTTSPTLARRLALVGCCCALCGAVLPPAATLRSVASGEYVCRDRGRCYLRRWETRRIAAALRETEEAA